MRAFKNPRYTGKSELNAAAARLALSQGGNLSRAQLLEIGLSERAIEHGVEVGRLFRVYKGVYALGHLPTNPRDRARAALLAAGPRSALSDRSATAFWDLYRRWALPLELVSPLQKRIKGLRIRRCSTLIRRDVCVRDGITVTSPARTMLDIAPHTATKTLHRFHNELRMRRLINNQLLIDVAIRNPRHPGARRLLELAGASQGEAKRSSFEVDWAEFAANQALPPHLINVKVAGETIDVLFTPDRLIIELDGWGTHGTRRAFEQDREQDASILAATGIPTMRITYDGLHLRPREQVRRINAILARR